MVENDQQPPPPADREAAAASNAAALQKKRRRKCILFIVLFIVFQAALITTFDLTVMKVRTPKFSLSAADLTDFRTGDPAGPSLRGTMSAEFSVRNANFGRYRYDGTTVEFFYRGTKVGEATVAESRANWRSTRKFSVDLDLNLANARSNSQLSSDLRGGVIPITSSAKMKGIVDLLFFLRKNRSTDMKCSMKIELQQHQPPFVWNIKCD